MSKAAADLRRDAVASRLHHAKGQEIHRDPPCRKAKQMAVGRAMVDFEDDDFDAATVELEESQIINSLAKVI